MSEKELNAYRLTSLGDPTDEMLFDIRNVTAEKATISTNIAPANYFKEISTMLQKRVAVL